MPQFINRSSFLKTPINKKFQIENCKFGKGLFAEVDIKKEEEILRFTGDLVSFEQAVTKDLKNQGDPLQVGKNIYINLEEPGRFVNHSCSPNAGIKNDFILVALKDIRRGEEIYFDYSTTMDEDFWVMQCECGNANCRNIVKDFKYLPSKVKRKYLDLNVVQQFIAIQYLAISNTANPK